MGFRIQSFKFLLSIRKEQFSAIIVAEEGIELNAFAGLYKNFSIQWTPELTSKL